MLRAVTPNGLDPLSLRVRALAVVFGKAALAEAAQFEPLPEEAAWTEELRPALMWRCAQGLKKLDSVPLQTQPQAKSLLV